MAKKCVLVLLFFSYIGNAQEENSEYFDSINGNARDFSTVRNCSLASDEDECNLMPECYWDDFNNLCKKHWMP